MELDNINNWKLSFAKNNYKIKFIIGFILLIIILITFPIFFNYIETREGAIINDWLIIHLPSINLSIPIFSFIWASAALLIVQAFKNPQIFLLFMWGFVLLSLSRMITIYTFPLNPPKNLVPLIDPISNAFYGGIFITKDLFFSGHTSTLLMMCLCLQKPLHKKLVFIATCLVGVMVLFQHVHYTIDVSMAFPLTYIIFLLAKKIATST